MTSTRTHANEAQKNIEPARQPEQESARRHEPGSLRQVAPQAAYRRAQVNGNGLRPADLLALQGTVGNRQVQRMVARRDEGRRLGAHELTYTIQQDGASLQRDDDITTSEISETTDTGNKYTQELVLNKAKARITVQLGVNWAKKGTWANDDAYNKFVRKVKTAAYSYMDNRFKVVCIPVAKGAGPQAIDLPIDFIIYDISAGYTIGLHGGTPGGDSAMAQAGGNVYEFDSGNNPEEAITYAHEFGHAMLGASDEYANPRVPGRVLTNDHSIMANYYTQGKTQAEFKAHHFQHIVTEVAKAFAGYSCSIKPI